MIPELVFTISGIPTLPHRHPFLQFFKPVQDDVDASAWWCHSRQTLLIPLIRKRGLSYGQVSASPFRRSLNDVMCLANAQSCSTFARVGDAGQGSIRQNQY